MPIGELQKIWAFSLDQASINLSNTSTHDTLSLLSYNFSAKVNGEIEHFVAHDLQRLIVRI